jgi:hypothetical protein
MIIIIIINEIVYVLKKVILKYIFIFIKLNLYKIIIFNIL